MNLFQRLNPFRWHRYRLAQMLRRTQQEVTHRFPAREAARRNAALQRMIDVLEQP